MPPKSQQRTPEYLIYTVPRNTCDPFIETFYAACRNNDAAVALQLAPGRDVRILTFGLSKALGEGHLDLARQLREAGAKWDTSTVFVAAKSLGTVKFLVESGFDINAALVGGGNILRYAD